MEFKIYLSSCPKCRQQTEHSIYSINRARGLKLRCLRCGEIKGRYYGADLLQEKTNEAKD